MDIFQPLFSILKCLRVITYYYTWVACSCKKNSFKHVFASMFLTKSRCTALDVPQVNDAKYAFPYSPSAILYSKGQLKPTQAVSNTLASEVRKLGS